MRKLNDAELETVSGARAVPAPGPKLPTTLLGVRLSKTDQQVLAGVISLLRPRKAAE